MSGESEVEIKVLQDTMWKKYQMIELDVCAKLVGRCAESDVDGDYEVGNMALREVLTNELEDKGFVVKSLVVRTENAASTNGQMGREIKMSLKDPNNMVEADFISTVALFNAIEK